MRILRQSAREICVAILRIINWKAVPLYRLQCVSLKYVSSTCFPFQADLLKLKLERAAMLVEGLSDERIRWEETVALLTESFEWLPGDCLISTGFVSYLGPFVSNYRQELISIWSQEVSSRTHREIPAVISYQLALQIPRGARNGSFRVTCLRQSPRVARRNRLLVRSFVFVAFSVSPCCRLASAACFLEASYLDRMREISAQSVRAYPTI